MIKKRKEKRISLFFRYIHTYIPKFVSIQDSSAQPDSKYKPRTLDNAATHAKMVIFPWRQGNTHSITGTIITYMVVINADFPP